MNGKMTLPERTYNAIRGSAEDLLGKGSFLECQRDHGTYPCAVLIVERDSIGEYLEENRMPKQYRYFSPILGGKIDEALGSVGTVVRNEGYFIEGLRIKTKGFRIKIYPGGESKENPFLD